MPMVSSLFSDQGEALYCLVIFGVLAAQCLVAVWAATSPQPRLWRALGVWAGIVVLIPVRAWWPALILMIHAVLVVAIIALVRRRVGNPAAKPRFRFGLSDLLIVMLFLGTILALIRNCHALPWAAAAILPLLVLPLAGVTACAALAALRPTPGKWVAATAALVPVAAAVYHWINIGQLLHIPTLVRLQYSGSRWRPSTITDQLLGLAGLALCCCAGAWIIYRIFQGAPRSAATGVGLLLLLIGAAAGGVVVGYGYADDLWHFSSFGIGRYVPVVVVIALALTALAAIVGAATWIGHHSFTRRHWLIRATAGVPLALVALPAAWLYWQMLGETRYPPPQLVGVNNYARLAEITHELGNRPLAQGRALVDESLPLLAAPNYVPAWALDAEARNLPGSLRGSEVRMLYQHLGLAMYEASERFDFDRGADYAVAAVRYSTMFGRGGTTGHAQLGNHFQEGRQWLERYRTQLSPAKSREVSEVLKRSTAELDPAALLEQRTKIYFDRSGGWSGRLKHILRDR